MSHEMKSPRATFADWQNWPGPDTRIVELLDGEIVVSPAPNLRHQTIVTRLLAALFEYRRTNDPSGRLFTAPTGVILSEACVVEPDIVYLRPENLGRMVADGIDGPPDLVVEVVSPSSRRHDSRTKRGLYAQFGVPEFWIVDADRKVIDVLRLEGESYRVAHFEGASVATSPFALPGFSIALARLFDDDMTKE